MTASHLPAVHLRRSWPYSSALTLLASLVLILLAKLEALLANAGTGVRRYTLRFSKALLQILGASGH